MVGLYLKPLFAKGVSSAEERSSFWTSQQHGYYWWNVSVWSRSPKAANVVCAHNFSLSEKGRSPFCKRLYHLRCAIFY
jgi:hypothetical protein